MKTKALSALACVLAVLLCSCASDVSESSFPDNIPESIPYDVTSDAFGNIPQQTDNVAGGQYGNTDETNDSSETQEPPERIIDTDAFDSRIEEIAAEYAAVGMGVCVFQDGEIIHSFNLGYADRENEILCDDDTLYRMSSVSKLVSTIALMTLYDDGLLDPYSELETLTGLPYDNPMYDEHVKLWQLLTHTAGITDNYAYIEAPTERYSTAYVLSTAYNGYRAGTFYIYSNFGMGTMGSIIEILTGEYFHDYADRVLFKPLGMNAAYCADMLENRQSCANLYQSGELAYSPKSWYRSTWYYESFGLGNSYLTANAELLISCADLARFGIILAGDGSVDGVEILSQSAVDAINHKYYSDPEGLNPANFDMGLCVRIYEDNLVEGRTIYGHPGQALGSVNGIYYDPTDHTSIAICTNGCLSYTDSENGVYCLLDECVNEAYRVFF